MMNELDINTLNTEIVADMGLKEVVALLDLQHPDIESLVYADERWKEMEVVDAGEVFAPYFPKGMIKLQRPKYRHPKVPKSDPTYIPQMNVLQTMLAWWCSPKQALSLFLFGETGTGKTEMTLFFADKMNWPLEIIQVNESMRPEKLQGGYTLQNGKTSYRYGGVSNGMKYGWAVLMDELDKASGDVTSKMHAPTDGKPWTLDDTGETIVPAANYRLIGTGNTSGSGDLTGRYHTSQRMDEAFKLRFAFLECDYPEPVVELQILAQFTQISDKTKKMMIKFAVEMRKALKGEGETISCAFSTRVLVAWCHYMTFFGSKNVPLRKSFDFTFGNSLDDDDRPVVDSLIQRIFDDAMDAPDPVK